MQTAAPRMTAREWGILFALSLLWGGSFFFLELALRELPPFTIVLLRVSLAAIPLWLLIRVQGDSLPRQPRIWGAFLLLGLLNNALPFALFGFAQLRIASGLASILNATTPLWGVIVAHLLTRDEKATPGKVAGVLLGFSGVAVMIGGGGRGGEAIPILMCLVATLCYALAAVHARRFRALGIKPIAVATGQLISSSLILLPIVLVLDRPWSLPMPGATTIWAMAGFVILSTSLAYWLYFRLLETAGATNSLLVTFLIPITAILLGALVLGEALAPRHYAGMALIALGLAAIDGRPFGWLTRRV